MHCPEMDTVTNLWEGCLHICHLQFLNSDHCIFCHRGKRNSIYCTLCFHMIVNSSNSTKWSRSDTKCQRTHEVTWSHKPEVVAFKLHIVSGVHASLADGGCSDHALHYLFESLGSNSKNFIVLNCEMPCTFIYMFSLPVICKTTPTFSGM